MPFRIIRNDITKVKADAIVNTANPRPVIGTGTDRAVYMAAGESDLLGARKKIGAISPGEAAVTPAFALPARYIIHTVGPAWTDGKHGEFDILASCYRKSLLLAEQLECGSIAFPLISTGVYGFPKDKALAVASRQIREFLKDSEMEILLVVFDKAAFCLSESITADVRQYIDDHYVSEQAKEEYARYYKADYAGSMPNALPDAAKERKPFWKRRRKEQQVFQEMSMPSAPAPSMPAPPVTGSLPKIPEDDALALTGSLQEVVDKVGESFQERLFHLIDERDLSDPQVYKKANIDRKLFSKIRCNADYHPGKRTVLALAVALKLNLDQTTDLMARAGFAFSPSSKMDLIVKYCIEQHIYDIIEVNTILFDYDQPLLG